MKGTEILMIDRVIGKVAFSFDIVNTEKIKD
jgi:hypothetical protein